MSKILIVDDHAILRKGLIKVMREDFPDTEYIEASNGIEALGLLKKHEFILAMIDIQMPEMDGIELLKQMNAQEIDVKSIILSMLPEEQFAVRVLKAGASGFIKKNSPSEEILKAVNRVLNGKKYIPEDIAELLAENLHFGKSENPLEILSDRELQVFTSLANGQSVGEIADEIGLSVNTISTYRTRILEKLQLTNNAGIIRLALDLKVI